MAQYRVKARSRAEPASLYSLLIHGKTWPFWMGVDAVEVERENHVERPLEQPETVGDVRIIRTGKYVNREQIVKLVPDQRFSYVILDGMLHDYKGDVILTALPGGGSEVAWSGSFRMSIPGAAWLMRLYLIRFMQRAVNGLARHAEKQPLDGSPYLSPSASGKA